MQQLAEAIALASLSESQLLPTESETEDGSEPPVNRGKMIADATCAPADPGAPGLPDRREFAQRSARENRRDHRPVARTVGRKNAASSDVSQKGSQAFCCFHQV